ncbi:MAG TPA: hypothetical protein VGD14_20645 [bacterium]
MKKRLVTIACLLFFFSLFQSSVIAQKLEPYGLQGMRVTALAYYGGALYAGTDGEGLFVRKSPDSSWSELGLKGVRIRSVYPHDIGPIGWGITVGTEPDKSAGDSVLTYCWSSYGPSWVLSDSGLDRNRVSRILSLDGFPDPRI